MFTRQFIHFATLFGQATLACLLLPACLNNPPDKQSPVTPGISSTQVELTVIKLDNQNPGLEFKTDTLLVQAVDPAKNKIDVYFSYQHFHIPYYMPTGSIYKDTIKEKECDWREYPATVKCYSYDDKDRVVKMQVEGSGTTGTHTFVYDSSDRIIEITGNSLDKYKMTYDNTGNLLQITVDGQMLQKKLIFHYDRK